MDHRPAGDQPGFAKWPLISLSNSLVRLGFSRKYGQRFKNAMRSRSWHTTCLDTICSVKSRESGPRWLPRISFFKRGAKTRRRAQGSFLVTVGLIGNKDCRRVHGWAQGNCERAVPAPHAILRDLARLCQAAATERPGSLYVYRFFRMFGCRMMSSREPRSPRGHAEGMVKTG